MEDIGEMCSMGNNKVGGIKRIPLDGGDDELEKAIVIRDLDSCAYKVEHITVKSLPLESNNTSDNINKANRGGSTFGEDKPVIIDALSDKEWEKDENMETEIPDGKNSKVYDFEMSKVKTLPIKLSPEEVTRLKRKWFCILSLVMSSILLIIIVIIVIIHSN